MSIRLSSITQCLKHMFVTKFAQLTWKRMLNEGYSVLCAIKLMGLTISRNLASRYATGPNFAGEIVPDVYIISSL